MNEKLDLKKTYKFLYQPSPKAPIIVDVPAFNFLMVDGTGNPNTSQTFQDATTALFSLAYALKFAVKKASGTDYAVMPLEGLWWMSENLPFDAENKDKWSWTIMINQPEMVNSSLVEELREDVRKKKNPSMLENVRFETFQEGPAVQIMHIGPFADEAPKIDWMHTIAREQGYTLVGKHHEIYLNDLTKTAPERLKTILRQPISKP